MKLLELVSDEGVEKQIFLCQDCNKEEIQKRKENEKDYIQINDSQEQILVEF